MADSVKLITQEIEKDNTPVWQIVLDEDSTGVSILAVNGGDSWYLLRLKNDGTFYRHDAIPTGAGFDVDGDGRLVESDLYE